MAKANPNTDTSAEPSDQGTTGGGKGRPTPSRREREAANRRPLVGNTPADKKAARSRMTSERERARIGLANGEEKYLPAKDRGDQRRYVRDHIDARWNVGEILLPVMVVVLIAGFVGSSFASYSILIIWVFVALFVIDTVITWFALRKKLTAKFGTLQRGTYWYIISRAWQMRFLRLPKPQVKRGEYPS